MSAWDYLYDIAEVEESLFIDERVGGIYWIAYVAKGLSVPGFSHLPVRIGAVGVKTPKNNASPSYTLADRMKNVWRVNFPVGPEGRLVCFVEFNVASNNDRHTLWRTELGVMSALNEFRVKYPRCSDSWFDLTPGQLAASIAKIRGELVSV